MPREKDHTSPTEDVQFQEARTRLKEEFFNNPAKAARAIAPLIERNMVRRMLSDESSENFELTQKKRLIWYYFGGRSKLMYRVVSQMIGQKKEEKQLLIKKYEGKYKYFRFFAPTTDPFNIRYVSGRINVVNENGLPVFHHWSHNFEDAKPEHTGFVFIGGDHIFFLGTRPGVLRLAIATAPNILSNDAIHGVVVSKRSSVPYDPFAARFVIVHESNTSLMERLTDNNTGKDVFFDITKGGYSYFMLTIPFASN